MKPHYSATLAAMFDDMKAVGTYLQMFGNNARLHPDDDFEELLVTKIITAEQYAAFLKVRDLYRDGIIPEDMFYPSWIQGRLSSQISAEIGNIFNESFTKHNG
jgi:hypothetical protein